MIFDNTPEILVIVVNRYQGSDGLKDITPISINKNLAVNNNIYELTGFINHLGPNFKFRNVFISLYLRYMVIFC